MSADTLWVYLGGARVGSLARRAGSCAFTYDPEARRQVSVRLPLRPEPYEPAACAPFFTNLLPEGGFRLSLSRQLGVAPEDDFGLLSAIGGDCAGAVAIRPERDWVPSLGRYEGTTEEHLRRWVKNPASRPAVAVTPGLRLSLAGAQDKLLIRIVDRTPYLCAGGAPSTVILKPDIRDAASAVVLSALNELLSLRLARAAGLSAPDAFWFASAFAVQRFDRERDGDTVHRLHQEDLAQILGVPAATKYSVTWKQTFDLVKRHTSAPAASRVELLDRLLFNLLLGNNDAHGKNFALLHGADGKVRLAPAYDLLSTEIYGALSRTFAMAIGPARSWDELDAPAWTHFARDVDVTYPYVKARSEVLVDAVRTALPSLLDDVTRDNPSLRRDIYPSRRREAFFRRFRSVVTRNARHLVRSLAR